MIRSKAQAPSISPEGGGNGEDISEESNYKYKNLELKTTQIEFPLLWRGVGERLCRN
jgi:hypothetical protein